MTFLKQYAGVALRVAKELYCYHQTVADVLKPLHFSDCQEDIENATLMNIEGKSDIVQAWMTVVEVWWYILVFFSIFFTDDLDILSYRDIIKCTFAGKLWKRWT